LVFFYISFNNVFQKAIPTQVLTNPLSLLRLTVCSTYLSSMALAILFFFEAIGRTDLLHPHPAPPSKTSKVFPKDFPKCLFARHSYFLPVHSAVLFMPHKTVRLLRFRILKSGSVVVYTPHIAVISQARRNLARKQFRECLLPLSLLSTRTNKALKKCWTMNFPLV